jgi:hypothetical protein
VKIRPSLGRFTTTAGSAPPAAIGPFLCSAEAPFLRPGPHIGNVAARSSGQEWPQAPRASMTLARQHDAQPQRS